MHLQRNDMLSTEGRAPRARRSCYVNEPAYGFFIAGSSLKGMNGVYIRRNPPRQTDEEEEERQILLYYEHMDTSWTLVLAESSELAESSPYFHRSVGERSEWAFVDERSHERFTHKGDTIVPGAGDRWKHVHRTSSGARRKHIKPRDIFGAGAVVGAQLSTHALHDPLYMLSSSSVLASYRKKNRHRMSHDT